MKRANKTDLLKHDIKSLQRENRQCKEVIEIQRKRLADLESLCLWSARRAAPSNRHYILDQLDKNIKM